MLLFVLLTLFLSNVCLCYEFQRYDGWYNNPHHLSHGSVLSNLIHKAKPNYADETYRMSTKDRPSPGLITDQLLKRGDGLQPSRPLTALFAFFGQIVSGEIISTISFGNVACPIEGAGVEIGRFGSGGASCTRDSSNDTCADKKTRKMPFFRTPFDDETGRHQSNPRRSINHVSSWIDGSIIYSSMEPWLNSMRRFEGGELWEVNGLPSRNAVRAPMLNPATSARDTTVNLMNPERQFLVGAFNSNQNPPLLAASIMMHKWHNVQARRLASLHPKWPEEHLFQMARRWTIATWQNIIFYQYLPALLNVDVPGYDGYNSALDPAITAEFAAAAFRFGHSLIPSGFFVRDINCNYTALSLCDFWWDSSVAIDEYGLDNIVRGLLSQHSEREDHRFSSGVAETLFGSMRMSQRDLPALTIMRGRDMGVADYNTVRQAYHLKPIKEWSEINPELFVQEPNLLDTLITLYNGSLDKVDLFTAGMLETTPKGPGATFSTIILEQFVRLRNADRYWFENEGMRLFTPEEIKQIKDTSLRDVILATTNIESAEIQLNVFFVGSSVCPQPAQMNLSMLSSCGPPIKNDLFAGSEWSFLFTFFALAAVPFVCCLVGWLISFHKEKLDTQGLLTRMSRIGTLRMRDTFIAFEQICPRTQRKVQIRLGSCHTIQVLSRQATALRTVDISLYAQIDVGLSYEASKKGCLFVMKLPKEYDLILMFRTFEERNDFLAHFRKFCTLSNKKVTETHGTQQALLESAVMLADRELILQTFFRTAFDQVFKAKRDMAGGGSYLQMCKSRKTSTVQHRKLLTVELNRQEFAQALQLLPESLFVQQMFSLADTDRNGFISFPEFIDLLVLMSKGSLESKMRMLFDMYDLNGSGDLDFTEFRTMVVSLVDIANQNLTEEQLSRLVEQMLADSDLGNKEQIVFEDFYRIVLKHQTILWNNLIFVRQNLKEKPNHRDSDSGTLGRDAQAGPTVQKPAERSWLAEHWRVVTYYLENQWSHVMIFVVFLSITALLTLQSVLEHGYYDEQTGVRKALGFGVSITRGAASGISFSMAAVLLSACRNIMTRLRDSVVGHFVPFDSAITFHRYAAYCAIFLSVMHTIGHGINFYEISTQPPFVVNCIFPEVLIPSDEMPKLHNWIFQTIPGFTGVLLVVLLSIMFVFSTHTARHYIYHVFWITHRLFPFVYALIIIHGSFKLLERPSFHLYFTGPAIVYIIDWLISLRRKSIVLRVTKVDMLPSDVLHLEFRLPPGFRFASGQWIRVAFDGLGSREFHPFTVTSAPHEEALSLYIRAVGPWTCRLLRHFSTRVTDHLSLPGILLDGPYGSTNQDWYKFETVVLIGAGIGVTPYSSVLKDLAWKVYQQKSDIVSKQVYFVWIARNHQQFEWFVDILREVERIDQHRLVTMDIFVTQLVKDFDIRTMMLYICEHHFQRLSNRSLFTGLRARTHFGRIDFAEYLQSVQTRSSRQEKIGVFSCGPKSMIVSLEDACHRLNQTGARPQLVPHHEIF